VESPEVREKGVVRDPIHLVDEVRLCVHDVRVALEGGDRIGDRGARRKPHELEPAERQGALDARPARAERLGLRRGAGGGLEAEEELTRHEAWRGRCGYRTDRRKKRRERADGKAKRQDPSPGRTLTQSNIGRPPARE
jgi:hypothetical protein